MTTLLEHSKLPRVAHQHWDIALQVSYLELPWPVRASSCLQVEALKSQMLALICSFHPNIRRSLLEDAAGAQKIGKRSNSALRSYISSIIFIASVASLEPK